MIKCYKFINGKRWKNSKGQYHRIKGPAVIWADGSEFWYKYDKLHRLDGPAYILASKTLADKAYALWWYKGKLIKNCKSQQEFERKIKLLAFL